MTLTEAIPKKLAKEEIIKLTLDYQDNFDQDWKASKRVSFLETRSWTSSHQASQERFVWLNGTGWEKLE